MKRPAIVAISGFSSEVGKTTLMCHLLRAFPLWEAIKVTRGHYRSCGKDPNSCCVSDLLSDEPVIRSGREENYAPGKDTGRYWDAGATNVHWVIVTDAQVEQGIGASAGTASPTQSAPSKGPGPNSGTGPMIYKTDPVTGKSYQSPGGGKWYEMPPVVS